MISFFRAYMLAEKSALHAMHGRPRLRMHTLLSLVTGLKSVPPEFGRRSMPSLALHKWTPRTMERGWARHCIRLRLGLGLYTKWVTALFSTSYRSKINFRLDISHATMRRITTLCSLNLLRIMNERQEKFLTSQRGTSGTHLFLFWFTLIINYLRCLAHILNLATQLLISTKSKAKYYSVHDDNVPDADIADPEQPNRDEVGLVRAICVKVRCPFIISCLN